MSAEKMTPLLGLSQISNSDLRFGKEFMGEDTTGIPHVYVNARPPNCSDMKELEKSAIVTIERNVDSYVCIHNVLHVMNRAGDIKPGVLQWKPFNDNKFQIIFESKVIRDKYLSANTALYYGDTCIRLKPFEVNEHHRRRPMVFKLWLVIRGLPVQHLCYKTAEIVASKFGRLYACDLEKKETFVGSFRIMIDCTDITGIDPMMVFHFEDDGETTIHIQKEYLCSIEDYKSMMLDEEKMTFEEVLYALLEANKLTALPE